MDRSNPNADIGGERPGLQPVYFLRIDLPRLRKRLAEAAGHEPTNDEAFDWLLGHGFRLGRLGWYATAGALRGG